MRILATIAALAALSGFAPARADEGMWTFNGFPRAEVGKRYGFTPDDRWLEHVRLSSARLAQGCSAGFVSADGLVMTNHHCAHVCIEQLSTPTKDFVKSGFLAKTAQDEVKCPELEVNQLVAIGDVTERMKKATDGLEGAKFHQAQRAEMSRVERECQTSPDLRCDVVTLYQGGRYDLYKYRRHQDVRLVFAPEFAIAFFGGDPDNFMFPRYDLDVAFLRVYEGGKPARMEHFFRWSPAGTKDGDLTFVSGHPGSTSRQLTVAQLEYQRDAAVPEALLDLAEWRGTLTEYQRRGAEQARHSSAGLFYAENSYKANRGRLQALQDKAFFAQKVKDEEAFRAKLANDPARAKGVLAAYDAIARAQEETRKIRLPLRYVERGLGFRSDLFSFARTLLRGAEERAKPSELRLKEFRESALPALTQRLFSAAPVYPELEVAKLTYGLTKLRENLGPDDPVVKKVLGPKSPAEVAAEVVKGSKLADPALRRRLWDGGPAAVRAAMDDPMIALAARVDPDARAVRKRFEEEIESVTNKSAETIAKARFDVEGTSRYPDATFTLRLSYGQVKGWVENGKPVVPYTTYAGAFERNTGREPFALPQSWLAAKQRLELATPFDLVTTNDIIGGNSGSPMVNRNAEIVGLVFDGNIHSLGGDFGFDERLNRTVAVDSRALLEALSKIYGAERIVRELKPDAGSGGR